ncbi:VOC family protein [Paramaledivibacter caminithermalis]|jgi:methylmalonyl-CoA/ethylmalonyl-CoA epimerase|uniref:Methylmalonyl-CoA epimerase n=1 Tax=Paramaledivibacter caminithermalis (strain DSM 15212 / CIP 107654 / DViRD3) TaxID=1121301 RepID=A0A1M6L776_PARC5|nr:VOC family protein [Paramaledivibacter caminithermalis]SHJ67063.1 methylmalonyl-CoA epimerase [Paramaledivibacter caminithermalis DSM 15212]
MKIHHIGYAVKDIDFSINQFKKIGYKMHKDKVIDDNRKVIIQFMKNNSYMIELISPLDKDSPINNIIKKVGSGPYHICYETNDIEKEIDILLKDKYILIEKPSKAIAIENRIVAFLFNKDIGIIELVEI